MMNTDADNPTGLNAYKPHEIANLVEQAGVAKTRLTFGQLFTLGALAGAFIALGAMFYTLVMTGADSAFGPARLLGGVAFSLGLILVVVGGAELFTGNALIVMAWVDRRVSTGALLVNWLIVYTANFIGSLVIVGLAIAAGVFELADGSVETTAARIAEGKFALSPVQGFARGALCNILVCLAVWLSFAARTVTGKILAIVWPISAFVALGLEHSVANMYLLPAGLFAGANGDIMDVAANLIPVTLGNIVGGAGGVALSYWAIYIRPPKYKQKSETATDA